MNVSGLLEQARLRLSLGERVFQPTSNARNVAILQETEDFSRNMFGYKAILQKYELALLAFLSFIPTACKIHLPRVWEDVEGTTMCKPLRNELSDKFPNRAGGEYDDVQIHDVIEVMQARLEGIKGLLDHWLDSLRAAKGRMKNLERLRMALDASRRKCHSTWNKQGFSCSRVKNSMRMRRAGYSPDIDTERQQESEETAKSDLKLLRDLEAAQESFNDQEEMVFEQLSKLCRDSAFFKSYAAASLIVFKDTVQAVLLAMGSTKRPLPGLADREEGAGRVGSRYGRVDSLVDLVQGIPNSIQYA